MAGQTETEFFWTFNERFAGLVKQAFGGAYLYTITYQPPKGQCLTSQAVTEATHSLFNTVPYVCIAEQTFQQKRWDKTGDYSQNWHSHLIVGEEGCAAAYDLCEEGHDIIVQPVFDLEGLLYYLSKQAGRNRILPVASMPSKVSPRSAEPKENCTSAEQTAIEVLLVINQLRSVQGRNFKLRPFTTSTALQALDHVVFLPNCPPKKLVTI